MLSKWGTIYLSRKEMFYFTTHSTHLFTVIWSQTYDIKDPLDSERGNPLPPHRLNLSNYQQGFFYMHYPRDRITHTMAFITPVVEHWLEWEIAQWVNHEGSIRWPIAPWANTVTMELHLAPCTKINHRQNVHGHTIQLGGGGGGEIHFPLTVNMGKTVGKIVLIFYLCNFRWCPL